MHSDITGNIKEYKRSTTFAIIMSLMVNVFIERIQIYRKVKLCVWKKEKGNGKEGEKVYLCLPPHLRCCRM